MIPTRLSLLVVLVGFATAPVAAAEGGGEIAIRTEAVPVDAGQKSESLPRAQQVARPVDLVEAAPSSLASKPAIEGARYAEIVLAGKRTVVATAADADSNLTVLADCNGDGILDPATESAKASLPAPPEPKKARIWSVSPWTVRGVPLALTVIDKGGTWTANVVATAGRRGTTSVDGTPYGFFLLDDDLDGFLGTPGDLWWFGPMALFAAKDFKNYSVMFEGNEACLAAGKAWRLSSVGGDGTARVVPAGTVDVEAYLARRGERVDHSMWFPKFARDREEFAKKQGIDLARPKAKTAPAWHHALDLDAALSMAAKEGKPLLLDVEADWCVWCKRMDYWTYDDAEVAAVLDRFTRVKVNGELDERAAVKRLGLASLPSILVVDAQGRPVKFTSLFREKDGDVTAEREVMGWTPPERFALHLKNAYAAWEKSKGGAAASSGR